MKLPTLWLRHIFCNPLRNIFSADFPVIPITHPGRIVGLKQSVPTMEDW